MKCIFHKIILNIFHYIHIIFLYKNFSVFCTGYVLSIYKSQELRETERERESEEAKIERESTLTPQCFNPIIRSAPFRRF